MKQKHMKFYQFMKTDIYKNAIIIDVYDTMGREVPDHEDIDEATVIEFKQRGGYIDVVIKRKRITYDDITIIHNGGTSYTLSARVNGWMFDRTYMFYPKREALRMFHDMVNHLIA